MESRVCEMFGDQLEHCWGVGSKSISEPLQHVGLERWNLRNEIKSLIGIGGEVRIPVLDKIGRCDWSIAVMVKDRGFLKTDKGSDAVINFGQIECNEAEVFIPPASDLISWDKWLESVVQYGIFIEATFGNGTVFNQS